MTKATSSTNYDLKWLRDRIGLTQRDTAKLLTDAGYPVTEQTVSLWETGASPIPRKKWFRLLGVVNLTQADIPQRAAVSPPAGPFTGADRRVSDRRSQDDRRAPIVRAETPSPELIAMRIAWVVERVYNVQTGTGYRLYPHRTYPEGWQAGLTYDARGYPVGWPAEKLLAVDVDRGTEIAALQELEGPAFAQRQAERDRLAQSGELC